MAVEPDGQRHRPGSKSSRRNGAPPVLDRWGTLRARLTAGAAILLGILALGIFLYLPARARNAAETTLHGQAATLVSFGARALAPALAGADTQAAALVVDAIVADAGPLYVIVVDDADRTFVVHNPFAADRARFRDLDRGPVVPGGSIYRVGHEIPGTERAAGWLYLGFPLDPVRAAVSRARRDAALLAALILLFGGGGIFGIATLLTRPLREIVKTVEAVAAGDLARRTELRSRDEIGYLGRSFDTMVARLEQAYGALQAANRDLEERVADRTRMLRREIDDRVRAEELLRASEHRFRTMFDAAAVGMALVGPDGRFAESNPSLQAMLGLARADLQGTPVATLVEVEDRSTWSRLERRLREGPDSVNEEVRFRSADGRTVWTRIVASGVEATDNATSAATVMIENITERKALEEQLRQAQKLEAVGRLAGGIAHDFNNLLTTINGLAEMLIAGERSDPQLSRDLEEIHKAGERAAALTAQLLAFSRRQIVMPEVLDLNATIRDMSAMLARLVGPDITLDLDLADDLHALHADPGQMAQVFMNLVVNSRDAMPHGGTVSISTRNFGIEAGHSAVGGRSGPHIEVTVRDDGEGMDAMTRQKIFEPFFTTKEQGRGTGLGLSTVYGIVQQTGGTIRVDSEPGRGATFTLHFPSLGAPAGPRSRLPQRETVRGNETILVVEDEPAVRALVARILRGTGYRVLEAGNGEGALEVFGRADGRVDLVLSDVVMPRMSGPELVRRLLLQRPDLRVLFMSGYTQDEVLDSDPDAPGAGFIQKPMSPRSLTRKLREVLDLRLV
jgi:PAS domain S-box-containing protein